MNVIQHLASNMVQSIRANRVTDLQHSAEELGHHFLYAYCGQAGNKDDVLQAIGKAFGFPEHFGQNFDALYDCLTDSVHRAGKQNGFVVVVEQIPYTDGFDRDARETLIDVFRDASDFWAKRQIPFRMFYSFV
ncbi:barstar family protein [Undibacterium cyanobacteriorum]|uniref:barstar family protein n=1 Tax=Undibacterium cyanobacteriorum TaxID=3073561 RepID=UPI0035A383C5